MRRPRVPLLVVMLVVMTILALLGRTPSEAQVSLDQYRQSIETLFSDWNAHKPQSRNALSKAIENSVKIQLGQSPPRFYQDQQWAQDVSARIERNIPAEIKPQLPIDADAFKRYRGLPESRYPEYSKLFSFPRDMVGSDLTAKFYFFMSTAEQSAATRKARKIEFPDLRHAMFFWESGVWPFCY